MATDTAFLLVSFGGPEGPDDVMPFLDDFRTKGISFDNLDTGEPLGERTWTADPATVRGIALASVPGGLAIAATTDGEMLACGKPVGTAGEQTAFVLWMRDL